MSVAGFTKEPANLVHPVVFDNNALSGCGNGVAGLITSFPLPEWRFKSFTMALQMPGTVVVNPAITFPASENPL
jgi:hypothetical protein